MSDNTLPPELVEKMLEASFIMDVSEANYCAQIAVDHSQEWKDRYNIERAVNGELRKQRDELIEFVQEVMETTTDKIRFEKANQLLKKHEDGKE